MFVITQHNKILLGPVEWNASYIASVLQNDLDLAQRPTVLPSDVFKVPYYILPEIYVRNAVIDKPDYNPKIQKFGGTSWTFDENNGYATHTIIDKEVDEVKGELKNIAASKRWEREHAGATVSIKDTIVKLSTSRDHRRVYIDKLSILKDDETCMWKFDESWLSIDKQNLIDIVRAIDLVVQNAFDWEIQKCNEIDSCDTLQQLDQINLDG